jgi:catechol 2,3-dioxygenase-like lactoylglutathione lyase family enzyme
MERAKKFYEETLGLQASDTREGAVYECGGGTRLALYQRETPTKADHTAAGWQVEDVEAVVQALGEKGVVFERYDMPGLKTDERGIASGGGVKGAWFKDPDGNILSVVQYG